MHSRVSDLAIAHLRYTFENFLGSSATKSLQHRWLELETFEVDQIPRWIGQCLGPDGVDLRKLYAINVLGCYQTKEDYVNLPSDARVLHRETTVVFLAEEYTKFLDLIPLVEYTPGNDDDIASNESEDILHEWELVRNQ